MENEFNIQLPPEMKGKCLQEIADCIQGHELFPEANKRVRELIANIEWPKELLIEKKYGCGSIPFLLANYL